MHNHLQNTPITGTWHIDPSNLFFFLPLVVVALSLTFTLFSLRLIFFSLFSSCQLLRVFAPFVLPVWACLGVPLVLAACQISIPRIRFPPSFPPSFLPLCWVVEQVRLCPVHRLVVDQ